MQIIFITVRTTQEKLAKLCALAQRHFEDGIPLLFMTADEKARDFLDDWLWKMPPSSFLPHTATNMPSKDTIVITSSNQNINQASVIFNLTLQPLLAELQALTIYEFDEQTSEPRQKMSEERFAAYRQKGYSISTEN